MSKKVKSKGKAPKQVEKPNETVKPDSKQEVEENDKSFDFGGIPNRDLKKNLGCG